MKLFYLTGTVLVQKDVWFIGNAFVNETFHVVKAIFTAAKGNWKNTLYVQREYNVECFTSHPQSLMNNVPAELVNVCIKALNDKKCTSQNVNLCS